MRADRLLSILLLLQVHRRLTARELARRLEVSERTILRDMDALGTAGVPVYAERGAGGGWSLLEAYRTNLTGLSRDEAQALFLSAPDRLLADLGLERASDSGLIKLLAALPAVQRDEAEHARQRIHIDLSGWHSSRDSVDSLPVIQHAVWQQRKLQFMYDRGDCATERTVDPLGLVAKGSTWYLVAAVDAQSRSYRVSRITVPRMLDEAFVRPKDFDLAATWETSSQQFKASMPRYVAKFRVSQDILPRLAFGGRFARIEDKGPIDSDGWAAVTVRFDIEEMAVEWALSFGPRIEVIEPSGLRGKVIELARKVLEFYSAAEPPI